jgi:hypothetical protein
MKKLGFIPVVVIIHIAGDGFQRYQKAISDKPNLK